MDPKPNDPILGVMVPGVGYRQPREQNGDSTSFTLTQSDPGHDASWRRWVVRWVVLGTHPPFENGGSTTSGPRGRFSSERHENRGLLTSCPGQSTIEAPFSVSVSIPR